MVLEIKDSNINQIKVFNNLQKEIPFKLNKNLFTYELIFQENLNLNELNVEINFNDILKIREVSFYEKKEVFENSKFYFYLNNQCSKTFNLYFGDFGKGGVNYYSNLNLPVSFNVNVKTEKNQLYSNDFDKDGILNQVDNCIYLNNSDQKDINYNNIGDACEDFDSDGILNAKDNCKDKFNSNQQDVDKDGIGDVCDKGGDNRFLQENKPLVYIIIFMVLLLFIGLSFFVMKK